MALASHSASALKQTLGARLAGATRKRECSPIFRHGTVGTFDDLGPVKEHLNGLDGSGSWENLQCSPKIPRQNSYNSEFLFERVVTGRKNWGGWYRVTWLCNQAQPCGPPLIRVSHVSLVLSFSGSNMGFEKVIRWLKCLHFRLRSCCRWNKLSLFKGNWSISLRFLSNFKE